MHDTARLRLIAIELTEDQRRLTRMGIAVFLLVGAVQALYGPALPSVRASFGIGVTTAGWTIGAHAAGAVTGVPLSLVLETRMRARTRIMIGLILMGVGAWVFAVISIWPWALAGVLCIGLGYGILVVAVNALFAAGFGERSAALVILVNACFGLGSVIGPLCYGLFSGVNFRPAFLIVGVLVLLVLPLGWATPEVAIPAQKPVTSADRHAPIALGAFVLLFLFYTAVESDTSGWMATHLVFHGYSQAAAAGFTAAFWAALTIGRFLSVPVSLWLSPFRMIGGAMSGVIAIALVAHYVAFTPLAYILIGLLLAPVFPVGFAWLNSTFHGRPGIASLALLGALAGALLFPVLVGRVIGANTPDVLPLALAVLAGAGLIVTVSIPRLISRAT